MKIPSIDSILAYQEVEALRVTEICSLSKGNIDVVIADRNKDFNTDAMRIGTAIHDLVLKIKYFQLYL